MGKSDLPMPRWLLPASYLLAALIFLPGLAHPYRTPKLAGLVLVLGLLIWRQGRGSDISLPAGLLFAWPLVSGCWSVNPRDFMDGALMLMVYAAAALVRPRGLLARRQIRRGLAWAGLATAAYQLLQALGWDPVPYLDLAAPGSFFGNPNFAAHFLLLAWCLGHFGRRPGTALPGRALLLSAILACGSRAVWLALLVWCWRYRGHVPMVPRRILYGLVLASAVVGLYSSRTDLQQGIGYLFQPDRYVAEYQRQPHLIANRLPWFAGKRLSLMTREILYGNSLNMLPDHGLAGVGLNQFATSYPRYAGAWVKDINLSEDYRARSAHNLLLDAGVQLGLPWLALALFLGVRIYRRSRRFRSYWCAIGLQAAVALVSLNYLNPIIVVTAFWLLPLRADGYRRPGRLGTAAVALVALVTACGLYWDHLAAKPHLGEGKLPGYIASRLLPERLASDYYQRGDYRMAWAYQVRALAQDPYGPETIFNTGLIAERVAPGDARWRELALRALMLNRDLHPHFTPARRRLQEIARDRGAEDLFPVAAAAEGNEAAFRELVHQLAPSASSPDGN